MPNPNCPECRGTGQYVGFNKVEPCSICSQEKRLICSYDLHSHLIWKKDIAVAYALHSYMVESLRKYNEDHRTPAEAVSDAMLASTNDRPVFEYLAEKANRLINVFVFHLFEVSGGFKFEWQAIDAFGREVNG